MLKGLLYAEFDNKQGAKILYHYPKDFINPDNGLVNFSEYIITKTQFCNRLITFSHQQQVFMGVPQIIENQKYERNALLFNLVLVFEEQLIHQSKWLDVYRPVIRKLAFLLRSLELESQFLSQKHTKQKLEDILKQIYIDLNEREETAILVDAAHAIHLKLTPQFPAPSVIHPHEVPIPVCDLMEMVNAEWDLTQQQIIPFINGVNFMKNIASKSNVHPELVKKCLRHLLYMNCIKIIDIFQYSNMYALQSRESILQLFTDKHLQDECLNYVVSESVETSASYSSLMLKKFKKSGTTTNKEQTVTIEDIARIYCAMKPGVRLSDILMTDPLLSSQINARCLVAFGLLKGFLRRVHEYPIIHDPLFELRSDVAKSAEKFLKPRSVSFMDNEKANIKGAQDHDSLYKQVYPLLDGTHSQDEICCELSISRKQLVRVLEQCKHAHVFYK